MSCPWNDTKKGKPYLSSWGPWKNCQA